MKEIIRKVILESVIVALKAQFPFLNIPVIGPLLIMIISKVFNMTYDELVKQGIMLHIELKTDMEKKRYEEATKDLKNALESNNEELLNEAKERFKKTLRDLVAFRIK